MLSPSLRNIYSNFFLKGGQIHHFSATRVLCMDSSVQVALKPASEKQNRPSATAANNMAGLTRQAQFTHISTECGHWNEVEVDHMNLSK
jgi:hypothetical protein